MLVLILIISILTIFLRLLPSYFPTMFPLTDSFAIISYLPITLALSLYYFYVEINTSKVISPLRLLPLSIFGTLYLFFLTISLFDIYIFTMRSGLNQIGLHHTFYMQTSLVLVISTSQLVRHHRRLYGKKARESVIILIVLTVLIQLNVISLIIEDNFPKYSGISSIIQLIISFLTYYLLRTYPNLIISIPQQISDFMITDSNGVVLYRLSNSGMGDNLFASGLAAINIFLATTIGSENSITYLTTDDKAIDIAKHGNIIGYLISDYSTYYMKESLKKLVVQISNFDQLKEVKKYKLDQTFFEDLKKLSSEYFPTYY